MKHQVSITRDGGFVTVTTPFDLSISEVGSRPKFSVAIVVLHCHCLREMVANTKCHSFRTESNNDNDRKTTT